MSDTTNPTPRRCDDGLVHWIIYSKRAKGYDEPGLWLRICDANDDNVHVKSLPLGRADVNCIACVAKEPAETIHFVEFKYTVVV